MAGYALRKKPKKNHDENYPGSAEDLENDPDWHDITHAEQKKHGHRVFENKKTGEKIRYDKGKPGATGHEGHDHYHRYNPKRTGDKD